MSLNISPLIFNEIFKKKQYIILHFAKLTKYTTIELKNKRHAIHIGTHAFTVIRINLLS